MNTKINVLPSRQNPEGPEDSLSYRLGLFCALKQKERMEMNMGGETETVDGLEDILE